MASGFRVTYRRSSIGHRARHRATLRSLGLRRLGDSRVVPDNPAVRGMLRQVAYMVEVEPVDLPPSEPEGRRGGERA